MANFPVGHPNGMAERIQVPSALQNLPAYIVLQRSYVFGQQVQAEPYKLNPVGQVAPLQLFPSDTNGVAVANGAAKN